MRRREGTYVWFFGIKLKFALAFEADNTVRENKNNCVMKAMGMLLSKQLIRCGCVLFSRTGHTHNCLGTLLVFVYKFLAFNCLHDPPCHYEFCAGLKLESSVVGSAVYNQDQLYGILAASVRYVDLISDVTDLISKLGLLWWQFLPCHILSSSWGGDAGAQLGMPGNSNLSWTASRFASG